MFFDPQPGSDGACRMQQRGRCQGFLRARRRLSRRTSSASIFRPVAALLARSSPRRSHSTGQFGNGGCELCDQFRSHQRLLINYFWRRSEVLHRCTPATHDRENDIAGCSDDAVNAERIAANEHDIDGTFVERCDSRERRPERLKPTARSSSATNRVLTPRCERAPRG